MWSWATCEISPYKVGEFINLTIDPLGLGFHWEFTGSYKRFCHLQTWAEKNCILNLNNHEKFWTIKYLQIYNNEYWIKNTTNKLLYD